MIKDSLRYFLLIYTVVLLIISFAGRLHAHESKTLILAGPSWDGFTNEDGSGLYHDLIREIFEEYDIQHIYVPTVQANAMVAIGRADIKMCETKEIESLVLARQPMYENNFYALYLREKHQPDEEFLTETNRFVWRAGYYSQKDFGVPVTFTEVRSGKSALEMVIHGRADFYIDDLALIKQSFADIGSELDPQLFGLTIIGTRKYFPVFANTPRGNSLREHYEQEIKRLAEEGKLKHIYEHYGFQVPVFQ